MFKPDRPAHNTRTQPGYTDPSKLTWEPVRTLGSGRHPVTPDTITSQKVHHLEGKGNNLRASDLSYILGVRRRDKWSSTHLRGEPRCPGLPDRCSEVSAGVPERMVHSPTLAPALTCKTQGHGPWPQSPSPSLLPCPALSVATENDENLPLKLKIAIIIIYDLANKKFHALSHFVPLVL